MGLLAKDRRLQAGIAVLTFGLILVTASVLAGSREVIHEQEFTIDDSKTNMGRTTLPQGDYELWWDDRDEDRPEASYVWFCMYGSDGPIDEVESDEPADAKFMEMDGERYELFSTFSLDQEEDISMEGNLQDDQFYRRTGRMVFIRKEIGNLPLALMGMALLVVGTLTISLVLMKTKEKGPNDGPSDPARQYPPPSPLDDGTFPFPPTPPTR